MRKICTKYHTASSIVKYDGTKIPDDEPLFLFRSQDKLTLQVLEFYRQLRVAAGDTDEKLARLDEQIKDIATWQKTHFTRMPV